MLLAIDTSGDWCSVALGTSQSSLFRAEPMSQGHARHLLGMIDAMLADAELSRSQLNAVAFTSGPGSFTGLRIGCAVAQGIGFALNIPVIAVPTTQVLAQRFNGFGESILVLFDARMGELYGQYFVSDVIRKSTNVSSPLLKPFVLPPADFVAKWGDLQQALLGSPASQENLNWRGVGNAWAKPEFGLDSIKIEAKSIDEQAYPRADWLLELALVRIASGDRPSAELATPLYIRNKVALTQVEQVALRAKNAQESR